MKQILGTQSAVIATKIHTPREGRVPPTWIGLLNSERFNEPSEEDTPPKPGEPGSVLYTQVA